MTPWALPGLLTLKRRRRLSTVLAWTTTSPTISRYVPLIAGSFIKPRTMGSGVWIWTRSHIRLNHQLASFSDSSQLFITQRWLHTWRHRCELLSYRQNAFADVQCCCSCRLRASCRRAAITAYSAFSSTTHIDRSAGVLAGG